MKQLIDNERWIVRSGVDKKRRVVGFAVWPKLFGIEIKDCVQKSLQNGLASSVNFRPCL